MIDPDEREALIREPQRFDGVLVSIPQVQLQKINAIIGAAVSGQELYALEMHKVANYLELQSYIQALQQDHMRKDLEAVWAEIDALPWPLSGGPRDQLDVPSSPQS